jgi:Domain of unknown function (DUF4412)
MKSPKLLIVSLLACVSAHADVVFEQKFEIGDQTSFVNRMKIKGDRARVDMKSPMGDVTIFLDKSGKMVTYIHSQKVVTTTAMSNIKKGIETKLEKAGAKTPQPEPAKPTGENETIGDWSCEIWTRTIPTGTVKEWRTKDIPNFKTILEQMKVIASMPGIDVGQADNPDAIAVKKVRTGPTRTDKITILKMSEEPVPESEFVAPTGYQEVEVPLE